MRDLLSNDDLKRLMSGVAVACASGLLLGAAMHPNLRAPKDAEGPQMLLGAGGTRAVRADVDAGVAAYGGRVPDYVIGTDWSQPSEPPVLVAEDRAPAAGDHAVDVEGGPLLRPDEPEDSAADPTTD